MSQAGFDALDQTVAAASGGREERVCPFCSTRNGLSELQHNKYRCSHCRSELAHLDPAPNGTVRGLFGWLLAPGDEVLNRYRIRSVLGKGGFGAAYLADDLQLSGKRRALKEVPAPMFDEYETHLLSRLDHPAIPDIIERREINGMVYLVLKFGGSRTLDSERRRYPDHRIPVPLLLPLMRQLCDVLVYLHSQTPPIIHRDLKPGNVLLDENERIMLIDFGIAKEALEEGQTHTLARATTPGYSPPEQISNTGTDERSDIYAFGATFYALLTGRPPPDAYELVSGRASLVPPSSSVPELPPELDQAILKALSLNMNHRQQAMREFAAVLGGNDPDATSRGIPDNLRTQPLGTGRSTHRSSRLSAGLKLPTAPNSTPRSQPGTRPATVPVSIRRHPAVPVLAGLAAALAVFAAGIYLYPSGSGTKSGAPVAATPSEPHVPLPAAAPGPASPQAQPAPPPAVSSIPMPAAPAVAAMPAPLPSVSTIAPIPQPPLGSRSATEILNEGRQLTPPLPVPPRPPVTTPSRVTASAGKRLDEKRENRPARTTPPPIRRQWTPAHNFVSPPSCSPHDASLGKC